MENLVKTTFTASAPVIRQQQALDSVYEQIEGGRIAVALEDLFEDLIGRRDEEPNAWPSYARACLDHPLRNLLHQDPLTCRAFSKPRGYAGDAVMMDYVYGLGEATEAARAATPLGRAISQYIETRPSARAVRYRRQLIAALIDHMAQRGGTSVLALAAGHLREVERSSAVRDGQIDEFVAFDQDEASLQVIDRDYAHLGIRTMPGSIRQILCGKVNPGQFDFVYAAGLYDYLTAPVASALTRRMFDMTRPGGQILIPNFLTGHRDSGYMESFMDWHLICRNHDEMAGLAAALPVNALADWHIFDDDEHAITYLLVSKAS